MKKIKRLSLFFCVVFFCACSSPEPAQKKTFLMRNYLAGKHLYKLNCQNCHQEDGKGQGRLYPPLAQADYFLDNPARTMCIIKHGIKGKILVNQQDYDVTMLGFSELGTQQISDIMTYIGNSWGNNLGDISAQDVEKVLHDCNK